MVDIDTIYIIKRLVISLITVFQFLILSRALLTWVPNKRNIYELSKFIDKATDPILNLFYKITNYKLVYNGVDFTMIFAYFILGFFRNIVIRVLF